MGAAKAGAGTAFRVWAPNAESVHLTGSFNGWADPGIPMIREEGGHWSVRSDEAKDGALYQYRIRHGGRSFLKPDARGKRFDKKSGASVVYHGTFDWDGDDFEPAPLNELVLYELHVGTFTDRGDLDAAAEKLPHLESLGVNGIELMPVMEFPGDTSWGYDMNHPFAVAEAYGGPDALKRFIRKAHRHGIAVIPDVIYNHFGPGELTLWRYDGWHEGERGGIYFYQDERAETPWGATRPDFGRGEVRQYLRDNALMWIDEFHCDGLRIDGVSHLRTTLGPGRDGTEAMPDGWSLMQWINKDLAARSQRLVRIGEGHGHAPELVVDVADDGAGFHTLWEPNFSRNIRPPLEAVRDEDRDAGRIVAAMEADFDDPFQRVIYIEAHDEVGNGKRRFPSAVDPEHPDSVWARRRTIQSAGLLFTSPGVPLMFQGQEFLEEGSFDDTRRLDWRKAERQAGIAAAFRELIHLRRNLRGSTRGLLARNLDIFERGGDRPLLAWHRWENGGPRDSTVCMMSLSSQPLGEQRIRMPRLGAWHVRFNADWRGYSEDFGNAPLIQLHTGDDMSARMDLPPYAFVVLSQDE